MWKTMISAVATIVAALVAALVTVFHQPILNEWKHFFGPKPAPVLLRIYIPANPEEQIRPIALDGDDDVPKGGYKPGAALGYAYPPGSEKGGTHPVYDKFCRDSQYCDGLKRTHIYTRQPDLVPEAGWREPEVVARFYNFVEGEECKPGQVAIYSFSRKNGKSTFRQVGPAKPGDNWKTVEGLGCLGKP